MAATTEEDTDMTHHLHRRTVLKGIAAGAITLTAVGPVSAAGETRYMVTVKGRGVRKRIERAGFRVTHELADGDVLAVVGSGGRDDLADVRGVRTVARDYQFRWDGPRDHADASDETTDDDFFPLQWDKQVTDVPEAHETATGNGTTLAIIDTGVAMNEHPDLQNVDAGASRLFRSLDIEGTDYSTIRSGTGTVEFPADPDDLCAGTTTITDHVADDVYFHGTHVAGIAAASRNAQASDENPDEFEGVVGTAPDADVVSLRVFYWDEFDFDCDGDDEVEEDAAALATTTLDIFLAIDYAAAIGADAANMSLGTFPLPPQANAGGIRAAEQRVVESAVRRGTVVVAAAGNDDTDLQHGGTFLLPASVPGAMAISATGPNDRRSFYSNYGTNVISVGAPGGGYETLAKTLSTTEEDDADDVDEPDEPGVEWPFPTNFVLNALDTDSWLGQTSDFSGRQYVYVIGTSMATPQVTGTVGLVREAAPNTNPKQVQRAIEQGAENVPGDSDADLGAGRLNCDRTLDAAAIE